MRTNWRKEYDAAMEVCHELRGELMKTKQTRIAIGAECDKLRGEISSLRGRLEIADRDLVRETQRNENLVSAVTIGMQALQDLARAENRPWWKFWK